MIMNVVGACVCVCDSNGFVQHVPVEQKQRLPPSCDALSVAQLFSKRDLRMSSITKYLTQPVNIWHLDPGPFAWSWRMAQ